LSQPLDPLRHLEAELAALERQGLLRKPSRLSRAPSPLLNLCSNDYLGYAADPWPELHDPSGAGASRLITGNDEAHESAESTIASWLGAPAALLFSSGYAANLGTITALAGPGDLIVSDALNHASIIDGCRLSGARVRVVPHLDTAAVELALTEAKDARRRWVVSESYFSMDGDIPNLRRLRSLCDAYDAALLIDEAHALGVFGPSGAGLCSEAGVRPDVLVGTAGKALGLHGAFVVGSTALRAFLWNRARSFVFSTGISPALARAIALRVERAARDDEARARLRQIEAQLHEGLAALGVEHPQQRRGPVIPWLLGAPQAALDFSQRLRERGILVQPIRPPTVPAGSARLRITAHARLQSTEVERALEAFAACRPLG